MDDIEAAAWDPDLLDWLASDFTEHSYDLQLLLRRIMTSRAYQMVAARESAPPKTGEEFVFRGPLRRRLTAEQFSDAVSAITGEWRLFDDRSGQPAPYARQWRFRSEPLTRAMGRPERFQVVTERSSETTALQALELVNGEQLRSQLRRGARRLTGTYREPPRNAADSGQVRTTTVKMEADLSLAKRVWLMTTDFGSYDRSKVLAGWLDAEFVGPQGSTRLLDLPLPAGAVKQPIQINGQGMREALITAGPGRIVYDIEGKGYTQFRGSAGLDNRGCGRRSLAKVRFFVFTGEPDKDELVRSTGEPPVARRELGSGETFVRNIFRYAVSREPSQPEMVDAKALLVKGRRVWRTAVDPVSYRRSSNFCARGDQMDRKIEQRIERATSRRDFLRRSAALTVATLASGEPGSLLGRRFPGSRPLTADAVILLGMGGGMAQTEHIRPKRYTPYSPGREIGGRVEHVRL